MLREAFHRRHVVVFLRTQKLAMRRVGITAIAILVGIGLAVFFASQPDYSSYADSVNNPQTLTNLSEITSAPDTSNYVPDDGLDGDDSLLSVLKDTDYIIRIYNANNNNKLAGSSDANDDIEYTGYFDGTETILAEIKNLNIDEKKVEDHKIYNFEIPIYLDLSNDTSSSSWTLLDTKSIINSWGRIVQKNGRYVLQLVFDNSAKAIHISADYQFAASMQNLPEEGGDVPFCFAGSKCVSVKIKDRPSPDNISLDKSCSWDISQNSRAGNLDGKWRCEIIITNPNNDKFSGTLTESASDNAVFVFYGGWTALYDSSSFKKYTLDIQKKATMNDAFSSVQLYRSSLSGYSASMQGGSHIGNNTFEYYYGIINDTSIQSDTGSGSYSSRNIDVDINESEFYQLKIIYYAEPLETDSSTNSLDIDSFVVTYNPTTTLQYNTSDGLSGTKIKDCFATRSGSNDIVQSFGGESLGWTRDISTDRLMGRKALSVNKGNVFKGNAVINPSSSRWITFELAPYSSPNDNHYYFMASDWVYDGSYGVFYPYISDSLRIKVRNESNQSSATNIFSSNFKGCDTDFSFMQYKDPILYADFMPTFLRESSYNKTRKTIVCYATQSILPNNYYSDNQTNNSHRGIWLVVWPETIAAATRAQNSSSNGVAAMLEDAAGNAIAPKFSILGVSNQTVELEWYMYQRQLSKDSKLSYNQTQTVGTSISYTTSHTSEVISKNYLTADNYVRNDMLRKTMTRLEDGAIKHDIYVDVTDLIGWYNSGGMYYGLDVKDNHYGLITEHLDSSHRLLTDNINYIRTNEQVVPSQATITYNLLGMRNEINSSIEGRGLFHGVYYDLNRKDFKYITQYYPMIGSTIDGFQPTTTRPTHKSFNTHYIALGSTLYQGGVNHITRNGRTYAHYMYISTPTLSKGFEDNIESYTEIQLRLDGSKLPIIDAKTQASSGDSNTTPPTFNQVASNYTQEKGYSAKISINPATRVAIDDGIDTDGTTEGNNQYLNGIKSISAYIQGTGRVAGLWAKEKRDIDVAKYFKLRDVRYITTSANGNANYQQTFTMPGIAPLFNHNTISSEAYDMFYPTTRYFARSTQYHASDSYSRYDGSNNVDAYLDYNVANVSTNDVNMANGVIFKLAAIKGLASADFYFDLSFDQDSFANDYPGYSYIDLSNVEFCENDIYDDTYTHRSPKCTMFDKTSASSDFAHIVIGPHIEEYTVQTSQASYFNRHTGKALVGPQATDFVYITNQIVEVGESTGYRYGLKDSDDNSQTQGTGTQPELTISPEAISEYANLLRYENLTIYMRNTENDSEPAIPVILNGEVQPGWVVSDVGSEQLNSITIPEGEIELGSGGEIFNFKISRDNGQIPANSQFDITYDYGFETDDFRDSEYYNGGLLTVTNQIAIVAKNGNSLPSSGTHTSAHYLTLHRGMKGGDLLQADDDDDKQHQTGKQTLEYQVTRLKGSAGKRTEQNSHWSDTLFVTATLDQEQAEDANKQYGDDILNDSWTQLWYKHVKIKNWSVEYEDRKDATAPVVQFTKTIKPDGSIVFTGTDDVVVDVKSNSLAYNNDDETWTFKNVSDAVDQWGVESYCSYIDKANVLQRIQDGGLPQETSKYGYCMNNVFTVDVNRQDFETDLTVKYEIEVDWSGLFREADTKGVPDLPRYSFINNAEVDNQKLWKNTASWHYEDSFNGRLSKTSDVDGKMVNYSLKLEVGTNGYDDLTLSDSLKPKDGTALSVQNNTELAIQHNSIKDFTIEDENGNTIYRHDGAISSDFELDDAADYYHSAMLSLNNTLFDLHFDRLEPNTTIVIKYSTDLNIAEFIDDGGFLDKDISYQNEARSTSGRYVLTAESSATIPGDLNPTVQKTTTKGETLYDTNFAISANIGSCPSEHFTITDTFDSNSRLPGDVKRNLSITHLKLYSTSTDDDEPFVIFDSSRDNFDSLRMLGWAFNDEFEFNKPGVFDFVLSYNNINRPLAANTIYHVEYTLHFDATTWQEETGSQALSLSWNPRNTASITRDGVSQLNVQTDTTSTINYALPVKKSGSVYTTLIGGSAGGKAIRWSAYINLDSFLSYEQLEQAQADAAKEDGLDNEYIHIIDNFPLGISLRENDTIRIVSTNPYKVLVKGQDYIIESDSKHFHIKLLKPHDYPELVIYYNTDVNVNTDSVSNSIDVKYEKENINKMASFENTNVIRPLKRAGLVRAYTKPSYRLEITKNLDGKLSAKPFQFEIREVSHSGEIVAGGFNNIIANNENGIAQTDVIEKDLGTYYYRIRELDTRDAKYHFDKTEYIAVVTASADEDSASPIVQLSIVRSDGFSAEKLEFNNKTSENDTDPNSPNPPTADTIASIFILFGTLTCFGLALWLYAIRARR